MIRSIVLVSFLALALVSLGCFGSGGSETSVKTMGEYRNEAESSVTPANAEQELDRLLKEIDSDTE